jgi:putative transposase
MKNSRPLGTIIGLFKSTVTKHIHQMNLANQENIWQRNYYDYIIRDDDDYQRIVEYIETNPSLGNRTQNIFLNNK